MRARTVSCLWLCRESERWARSCATRVVSRTRKVVSHVALPANQHFTFGELGLVPDQISGSLTDSFMEFQLLENDQHHRKDSSV